VELFLILMGGVGLAWAAGTLWLQVKPQADEQWDSCVACGSERLEWDRGDIEGPIDDVYWCLECGHQGGPGQEHRSKQAELAAFAAKSWDGKWRLILDHWREGHHQLSLANEFRNMAGQGGGAESAGPSWPMMDQAGRHQVKRAMELMEQLVGGSAGEVAAAMPVLERRPDKAIELCEGMHIEAASGIIDDLHARGLPLAEFTQELAWFQHDARGLLLSRYPALVSLSDVEVLGTDLPEDDAVAVVEGLLERHRDEPHLERTLLMLMTARGTGAAIAIGEALVEVGTPTGLRQLEDPPEVASRAQRQAYREAAAKLRERLSTYDGRLSIEAEAPVASDGGLSTTVSTEEAGELSLAE